MLAEAAVEPWIQEVIEFSNYGGYGGDGTASGITGSPVTRAGGGGGSGFGFNPGNGGQEAVEKDQDVLKEIPLQ
jgi:hypothetical protein